MGVEDPQFVIRLPTDPKTGFSEAQISAANFRQHYLETHPELADDPNTTGFLTDLGTGTPWRVFQRFRADDTSTVPPLSHDELQQVLDMCVGFALSENPAATGSPGNFRGHGILFEYLVEKTNTPFSGIIDEDLRKRLNNGRFWEELHSMNPSMNYGNSYQVVNDVLTQYHDDLDIGFVRHGYALFQRDQGETLDFDLLYITDEAVDRYGEFLSRIFDAREEVGLTMEQLANLVSPYVLEIIRFPEDSEPRFERGERPFQVRLQEPLVQTYLQFSPRIQNEVALQLSYTYDESEYFVEEVLANIPNPKQMKRRIDEMRKKRTE